MTKNREGIMSEDFNDKDEKYINDAKHCYDHLAHDIVTPQTRELATKIHDALCSGAYSNGTILAALAAVTGFVLAEAQDRNFAYAMTAAVAAAVRNIFDRAKEAKDAEKPKDAPMNMIFTRRPGSN